MTSIFTAGFNKRILLMSWLTIRGRQFLCWQPLRVRFFIKLLHAFERFLKILKLLPRGLGINFHPLWRI
jgi:hypothetical protein